MLMEAYTGAINEDKGGRLTALSLEARPGLASDATRLPLAAAVVDGVPMATFDGQIPPGEAGAGETQHRFDEPTGAQLWGASGFALDSREARFNFSPGLIDEEHADRHRHGPSWVGHRGHRTPEP
jgi:hypothetical protein